MFFFLALWSQNGKLDPPLPLWLLESKNAPILLRNEPLISKVTIHDLIYHCELNLLIRAEIINYDRLFRQKHVLFFNDFMLEKLAPGVTPIGLHNEYTKSFK